jgi:hypothetical protein
VIGFSIAELVGGVIAIVLLRILYPDVTAADAARVIVPHQGATP